MRFFIEAGSRQQAAGRRQRRQENIP